jgi:hypothetical protein
MKSPRKKRRSPPPIPARSPQLAAACRVLTWLAVRLQTERALKAQGIEVPRPLLR